MAGLACSPHVRRDSYYNAGGANKERARQSGGQGEFAAEDAEDSGEAQRNLCALLCALRILWGEKQTTPRRSEHVGQEYPCAHSSGGYNRAPEADRYDDMEGTEWPTVCVVCWEQG